MGSQAPSAPSRQPRLAPCSVGLGRGRSAGAGRAVPGCAEEPQPLASPAEARRFLRTPPAPGGCPQVNKYMAEPGYRGCPSPGVLPLLPLSPRQFGGFSALPKPSAAAPPPSSPVLCCSPPFSSLALLTLLPPQAAAPSPSSGAKSPPPGPVSRVLPQLPPPPRGPPGCTPGPPSHPAAPPSSSVGTVTPQPPRPLPHRGGRGTLTGRVCGMGLPARLFLEMEGVFINSRFFRENMVPGGGRAPALGGPSLGRAAVPGCQHRAPHRAGHIRWGELSGGRV